MAVKNIIFDLGGVILNIDLRKTQNAFTALGVKRIDEVFRMGHVASFFKEYETGTIDDTEFITSIQNMAGLKLAPEAIIDAWNALLLDFPAERIDFLKQIRKKYRLFLLSNTSGLHHSMFHKMFSEEYGESFDDLFDKAYYSHIIRLHKPDIASYRLIIDENHLIPGETLFVDDSPPNVDGAERAGLKGLHLAPGKTILDLGL